jgi:phosphatidylinositol-3,4,5-trisphosphate-dependent Rac exchanger protein 1
MSWELRDFPQPHRYLSHTLQLIRPINALDELCRLMKSLVHPRPGASGNLGAGLVPISLELCYRLGACQIVMCGSGMQR